MVSTSFRVYPISQILRTASTALVIAMGSHAYGQWTFVNLHPPGSTFSQAKGVKGGQQVGVALDSGGYRAGFWTGTPDSWIALSPAGAPASFAQAVSTSGTRQVGTRTSPAPIEAFIWSGSMGSQVSLNPPGATISTVNDIYGDRQGGMVNYRAALWYGTDASFVDLNPPGVQYSGLTAIYGYQQVGSVGGHAYLWTGTAASAVDLHPAQSGAFSSSLSGVHRGHQVGVVPFYDPNGEQDFNHAGLWSGTAASWIDLHPPSNGQPEISASTATAVYHTQQVGWISTGGNSNAFAAHWTGSAASYFSLHSVLPPEYTLSQAFDIWSDSVHTYVVGYGYNSAVGQNQALMWLGPPIPAPPAPGDVDGDDDIDLDDAAAFFNCMLGPDVSTPSDCSGARMDTDTDVDMLDFAEFQVAFGGP